MIFVCRIKPKRGWKAGEMSVFSPFRWGDSSPRGGNRGLMPRRRSYVDELAAVATFGELNCAADKGHRGYGLYRYLVQTGVKGGCTALAFQDIAGFGILTAENLNTESFAFQTRDRSLNCRRLLCAIVF